MFNIISPEKLIQLTVNNDCDGIAWTYNEPGIWLNYTLDCARAAKKQGLYTVYVTNGYATFEHLDMIAPYLDVYRVDIKSMNDEFYKKLIKVSSVKGVLDTVHRAKTKWGLHIECVTNVIPGWNDSEDNLRLTARWIAENIGKNTPWHVTRFFPYGELSNINPTPIETLQMAYKIGREEGLNFVYIGNARTQTGENTYCPECGKLAIRRIGYASELLGVTNEGKCSVDGTDLNVIL